MCDWEFNLMLHVTLHSAGVSAVSALIVLFYAVTFLVARYATLHPALSVGLLVTLYFFWVFAVFGLTAPAQMIK